MCLLSLSWATLRPALTPSTERRHRSGERPSTCEQNSSSVYIYIPPYMPLPPSSDIKDVHSPLEVSVYSAKSKPELIGRIKIPLLRVCAVG